MPEMLAVIVIDMIKDNIFEGAKKIIPRIKKLLEVARAHRIPIIYANDSFFPFDPMFERIRRHAIRGTAGTQVIDELKPERGDIIVEKRRFSAFFKTDLDLTLRCLNVDTVALCGINTWACVLFTAADAVSLDFKCILIEDCCASHRKEIHESIIKIYKEFPLIEILKCDEVIQRMHGVDAHAASKT